jgi:lysophospholipase L1-like esterase
MKRAAIKKLWQKALYRTFCGLTLVIFIVTIWGRTFIHAEVNNARPAWANPNAMAIKRISAIDPVQHQPTLLSNMDCTSLTYRTVNSNTMQTGCFTPTAFGMLDSDSENVIFNGTDEAVPLSSYSPQQVLVPWPKALNLLTLDTANTGGSYVGMYKNPIAAIQNKRNALGQLTSKQLAAPPEVSLKDQSGQKLIINAQTMAFSDGGSWLVVETLGGSFVRINLASLDMTAFAQSFGSQGSPGTLLKSQVTVSSDGRYVAIENTAASSLKVYDLASCGSNTSSWQTSGCQAHEYWPFVSQQVSGLQSIHHVRFLNDGLLSFEATSTNPVNSGVYELAPTANITSLTDYIGLGDSYTSGEGAFNYLSGTDTGDNSCHVSINSYPLLLAHDLFSNAGGHSVACSGAVIEDVGGTSDSYRGQVRNGARLSDLMQSPAFLDAIYANYTPGYIAQQWFVKQYQPQVATVSVGGNDIGFGDMLQNCVEPHVSRHLSDSTCYDTYESRLEMTQLINRTIPRWTALYKQLQTEAPMMRLYAIGYPSIASDTGKCGLNVNLGKGELEFAEELIAYLNGAVRQSASAAGIPYIDISQALAGHRLCEASGNGVAVNGLTAGNDSGGLGIKVLGKESYHPNALGHQLIEQEILKQSHNLTSTVGNASANDPKDILNAPKSGRATSALMPDDSLTSPLITTSASTPIHADGVRDGLQPNSNYSIRLDGLSGAVLAQLSSDANGDLSGQITVPAGVPPGSHTLDVTGINQAGEPTDVTQPIYISNGNNDIDGDGIVDSADSCPTAINSSVDANHDNIDDICDSIIVGAPSSNDDKNGTTPTSPVIANNVQPAAQTPNATGNNSDAPTASGSTNTISLVSASLAELSQTSNIVAGLHSNEPTAMPLLEANGSTKVSAVLSAQKIPAFHHFRKNAGSPALKELSSPATFKLPFLMPWLFVATCCFAFLIAYARRRKDTDSEHIFIEHGD